MQNVGVSCPEAIEACYNKSQEVRWSAFQPQTLRVLACSFLNACVVGTDILLVSL